MRCWLVLGSAALGACSIEGTGGAVEAARVEAAAAEPPPPGGVIDSAMPIAEHLRRFRVGLDSTARLEGGSPTPTLLAQRFLRAVAARDTADLSRMVLSRREFAWIYYPRHIYYAPPYELDPGTFWTLIRGNSGKGSGRIVRRYGGRELRFRALRCTPGGNVLPPLRELDRCIMEFTVEGAGESRRMFGSIIGGHGSFKFVSYANEF